ncbi:YbdK family carboxylate-amine ligase [Tessaracoccus sp. OH4464_COT-324]|uniref:carboxylate-amine ligase n=1 Tax=Tessaracoccus sp. OH4464_COT-324 TaxID=2491059 RepID=UPI000F64180B|nr:YbdK family carboxylate-amine ligase [Tessaracoccus sp. OH4464_COT-324]RRD47459.1 YbdK family carboxylate-amine ligase [Tessaracoccus sp. OH4464_COT-324]
MEVRFGESRRSTIGVEWELAIIDASTLEQVPGAGYLLDRVQDPENGPIRGEFLDSMVELVTGVHTRVADAERELTELLHQVLGWLAPHGLTVLPVGAHPFSDPTKQRLRDKPQYRRVAERNAWWGRQMAVNGTHVHVGVTDREMAIKLTSILAKFGCYFIGLTASSPFWLGEDTGFASQRTMLFQQLATNGAPEPLTSWAQYERFLTDLHDNGVIESPGELRWDVRPSPWGTVENRLMDSVPTPWELGAVAAFSQCLAEKALRDLEHDTRADSLPHWVMRENKWRAARYGLDADVLTPRPDQRITKLGAGIRFWFDEVTRIAEELGCREELERLRLLLDGGPSYVRQRRVWGATGSVHDMVRHIVDEVEGGRPIP